MLSASEYTCTNSSLRHDLHSWMTGRTKTKETALVSEVSHPIKLKGTDLTACPLIAPNHRSSGHGWELVCGKPWQPKWHSQLGPSLVQLRSRASLHAFCRNAWGFSSALFYCPWAPAKGSSGHNPPESALTHRGSMHLSKEGKSDKYKKTGHLPGITWGVRMEWLDWANLSIPGLKLF